jgi:hypothetical protein
MAADAGELLRRTRAPLDTAHAEFTAQFPPELAALATVRPGDLSVRGLIRRALDTDDLSADPHAAPPPAQHSTPHPLGAGEIPPYDRAAT